MEKKIVVATVITLLLTSMLTLAFNIQPVKATERLVPLLDTFKTVLESNTSENGWPFVIYDAGLYKMWYGTGSAIGADVYAESNDGITWLIKQTFHNCTFPQETGDTWVIKEGGTYRMWHRDYYEVVAGDWSSYIAYMSSSDGISWPDFMSANDTKVLSAQGQSNPQGDGYCVLAPCVIHEPSGYVMWYSVDDHPSPGVSGPCKIWRATSDDGISWSNRQLSLPYVPNTWENNVLFASVVKEDDGTYTMFYEANDATWSNSSIGIAKSTDGISWTNRTQLLNPSDLGVNITGLNCPFHFTDVDGKRYLYFGYYDNSDAIWKFGRIQLAIAHDVAISNVVPSKTVVGQGYSVPINVTVANQGSYAENFNVSIYTDSFYDQFDVWNYTGAWGYFNPIAAEGYVSVSDGMLHVSGYWDGNYRDGGITTIKEFNYPVTVETKLRANSADHSPRLEFGPLNLPGCISIQYDIFDGGWHATYVDTTGNHDIVWGGSISAGTWYTLKLVVNETNFKVYLDDALEVNTAWSPPQKYPKTISLATTYGSYGSGDFDWVKIATILQTKAITLTSGSSATLAFVWNTTGFAYGNYTISAYAETVPNETDTANNNCTDGVIIVTIPGDLNGDFQVSLTDLVLLANAYGSKPGDAKWNSNADINGNGVVDLADLVIMANHYGQHYP